MLSIVTAQQLVLSKRTVIPFLLLLLLLFLLILFILYYYIISQSVKKQITRQNSGKEVRATRANITIAEARCFSLEACVVLDKTDGEIFIRTIHQKSDNDLGSSASMHKQDDLIKVQPQLVFFAKARRIVVWK